MATPIPNADKLIDDALEALIGIEGGFVDDPNDAGGATRWGVTEAIARSHGYKGAMKDLPRDTAKTILRQVYYVQPRFHEVAQIDPRLAYELFEIEVNLPPGKAMKFMQRALNGCNDPKGTAVAKDLLYPDQAVDGQYGPACHSALQKFVKHRGKEGLLVLMRLIDSQQGVYYLERQEARPKNKKFLYGWVLHRITVQ